MGVLDDSDPAIGESKLLVWVFRISLQFVQIEHGQVL
jgi:hypothetical protein